MFTLFHIYVNRYSSRKSPQVCFCNCCQVTFEGISVFTARTTFGTQTTHHTMSVPLTRELCCHLEILKYLINRKKTCLKAADVQIAAWWAICMKSEHSIWIPSISFPTHPPEWPFHLPASRLLSAATWSPTSHRRRKLHYCCKALSTFVSCLMYDDFDERSLHNLKDEKNIFLIIKSLQYNNGPKRTGIRKWVVLLCCIKYWP